MKRIGFLAMCLLVFAFASQAHAGLMIAFGDADELLDSFSVGIGDEIDVYVYVKQTNGTDVLDVSGLFSAGVQVAKDPAKVFSEVTGAALADHWGGPFDSADFDPDTGIAVMTGSITVGSDDYVKPTVIEDAVLIGTITYRGLAAGISLLVSSDPDDTSDDVNSGDFEPLDDLVFASPARATLTTVPEPSSLLLVVSGLAIAGGVGLVRRRRNGN